MVVYSFLNEMIDNRKISEVWRSPEVSAVSRQGKLAAPDADSAAANGLNSLLYSLVLC